MPDTKTPESRRAPAGLAEGKILPPRINFDPADAFLGALDSGRFESLKAFELSLEARRLLLVSGFQDLISLPTLKNVESYAFQTETALRVLRRYNGRALLCDEVGLGKTIEAGIILKEYMLRGMLKKTLILAPPGLVGQWKEEMDAKFGLAFMTPADDAFRSKGDRAWAYFPRVIAPLSLAKRSRHARAIVPIRYDMVLVDEAHHLKNRASVAWRFVNSLEKRFLLLLTATPVQNDLEELFNLVTLLKPGQLKTLQDFKKRFVARGDSRKPRNTDRLRELLGECMIRNTRAQMDRRLPPRQAHTIKIKLSPEESAVYERVTALVRTLYPEAREDAAPGINANPEEAGPGGAAALDAAPGETIADAGSNEKGVAGESGKVRRLPKLVLQTLQSEIGSSAAAFLSTGRTLLTSDKLPPAARSLLEEAVSLAAGLGAGAKGEALISLLRGLPGEKVLVFSRYRRTIEQLKALLEERGFKAGVYHGGMTTPRKDAVVGDFEGELQVLLSTEAGGEGRNLQFCRILVNFDLPYNPMKIEQRAGRLHRIGQTRPVVIYNLAAAGTLEDYLLRILDDKIHMFELVIGEMDMILGRIEEEGDFENLLLDLWARAKTKMELESAMEDLGERMVRAKLDYLETRELDEKIFAEDFEAS